ncbi:MAG TPA: winged helix-turn-helix domain-containing protein, partial [Phnomibacter sp.]|nr:winged helix-turn-helix domain-containing protein [Phnomibacter sp.]
MPAVTTRKKILSHFSVDSLSGVAFKDHSRRKRIIERLSGLEEITINEISESLNISVPKATELLAELQREGFVEERGKRSEGPGRKATFYGLASNSCYFLGLEIKKYKINIGVMGFDKTLVKGSYDIPFFLEDANESLAEIVKQVRKFIDESGVPIEKIVGMGVSISGRINVKTGEILTIYHFSDAPVKQVLEEAFEMPIYL